MSANETTIDMSVHLKAVPEFIFDEAISGSGSKWIDIQVDGHEITMFTSQLDNEQLGIFGHRFIAAGVQLLKEIDDDE